MTDFARYQALGNDYVVVDPHRTAFAPTPEAVRLLCDRHFGIGADGLLYGPVGPVEPGAPVRLRIYNPDGCECERSGNGIRMFALYLAEHYATGERFVVRTSAGDAPVHVRDFAAGVVQVDMGLPRFDAADVPVLGATGPVVGERLVLADRELTVTCVNVGNPHTVVPLDEISADLARELGPLVRDHPRFPARTNVQLLRVRDRSNVDIEIFERGAGYTLASGSSSCAAAAAARALGLVGDEVAVWMPGGRIDVSFGADGAIRMTGAAEQVAAGDFAPAFRARLAAAGALPEPAPAAAAGGGRPR